MHRERALLFKVGLMVVAGLSILSVLIFMTGGLHLRRGGWSLTIVFDYVAGLGENAPVRVAGMEVGEVRSIRMRDGRIYVEAWLIEEVKIHDDATATIESMGLIGEKYLSITMGSKDRPILGDGAKIQGENPITLKEVLERGETIAARIEYVTKKIENGARLLDEGFKGVDLLERVDRILTNVDSITSNLNSLITEGKEEVSSGLSNLRESTGELKEATTQIRLATTKVLSVLKEIEKGFTGKGEDIRAVISNLEDITYKLNSTLESVKNITRHIEEGRGPAGMLIFDEEMAKNLDETIVDLRELAKDLRANPWKLMRKR
jgi:phospholipid/cholesterol/gamma-HCH transport system substrate-binding protein